MVFGRVQSIQDWATRADKFRNNSGLEADRLLRYDGQNNSDHFRLEQKIFKETYFRDTEQKPAYQQDVYDVFRFHISQISIDTINGVQEIGVAQAGVYGTYDLHLAGRSTCIAYRSSHRYGRLQRRNQQPAEAIVAQDRHAVQNHR